ncbi:hypothetical protein C7377_0333 [Balneicella halophila]|uniref:Cupin type-2 domain-containing protein n=1 Tax=Balneicella halophila TaxID=1537566 RepID=A0A7L4UQI2_BALHA|nr:cupin domain-containing protein [Balneicella halophila]PVX52038.1 hypothetical protein C7377_0333 [Balneicella halophila]
MKTAKIIENLTYGDKPAISVLFETENTKEVRILMREGQEMKEHKTSYPITVEIFEGEIDFGVNGEQYIINRGDILSLEGGVPHNLKALKDSIVRLSLSKSDQVNRVIKVAKQ